MTKQLVASGKFKEAIPKLEQVLAATDDEAKKNQAEARYLLGLSRYRSGDLAGAIAVFDQILAEKSGQLSRRRRLSALQGERVALRRGSERREPAGVRAGADRVPPRVPQAQGGARGAVPPRRDAPAPGEVRRGRGRVRAGERRSVLRGSRRVRDGPVSREASRADAGGDQARPRAHDAGAGRARRLLVADGESRSQIVRRRAGRRLQRAGRAHERVPRGARREARLRACPAVARRLRGEVPEARERAPAGREAAAPGTLADRQSPGGGRRSGAPGGRDARSHAISTISPRAF